MTLFKYVEPARVDILENERIAFNPPDRFNDAYELRPHVAVPNRAYRKQRVDETVQELRCEGDDPISAAPRKERRHLERESKKAVVKLSGPVYAKKMPSGIQVEASKHLGILCLSGCNDNELMWSHYADGHRGFVIEFDCNHPEFQQLGQHWIVEYPVDGKRPVYNPQKPAAQFWLSKPLCWKDEKEYRIMRQLKDRKEEIVKCGKVFYLYEVPRVSIKAVYLGHRLDCAIRGRILDALSQTKAVKYVQVPSKEDYTFSFQVIS